MTNTANTLNLVGNTFEIATLMPGESIGLWVEPLGIIVPVRCEGSNCGEHIWDTIIIGGVRCGNRHGGRMVLKALYGFETVEWATRDAERIREDFS